MLVTATVVRTEAAVSFPGRGGEMEGTEGRVWERKGQRARSRGWRKERKMWSEDQRGEGGGLDHRVSVCPLTEEDKGLRDQEADRPAGKVKERSGKGGEGSMQNLRIERRRSPLIPSQTIPTSPPNHRPSPHLTPLIAPLLTTRRSASPAASGAGGRCGAPGA